MKKLSFDQLLEIIKQYKDDPLQQVMQTTYEVDGYYVRLLGEFVQWRTPVQSNFTFGLTFGEFIQQVESLK